MQGFDKIVHVNGNIYDIGRASDKDLRFFLKKLYDKQDSLLDKQNEELEKILM